MSDTFLWNPYLRKKNKITKYFLVPSRLLTHHMQNNRTVDYK